MQRQYDRAPSFVVFGIESLETLRDCRQLGLSSAYVGRGTKTANHKVVVVASGIQSSVSSGNVAASGTMPTTVYRSVPRRMD